MIWGLTVACVAALALAAPSFALNEPDFTVVPWQVGLNRVADTELDLTLPTTTAAAAKVVFYVAPGYTANLTQAPGTKVGTLDAKVDAGGTQLTLSNVAVTADDPAKYTTNPQAQACAAGKHAAVWVITVTLGASTLNIPIYVDPTAGDETALGSYKLQVCFSSPYVPESAGGAPAGARLTEADIDFPKVFSNPSAAGVYRWRAFVTPYTVGSATPNAAATYELRSLAQLPLRIGMRGRYDARKHQAVLNGTFRPSPDLSLPASVIVEIYRDTGSGLKHIGHARTKKGKFTFRARQTRRRVVYFAAVFYAGACTAPPSPAPAGCTRETVAPALSAFIRVPAKKR